MNATTAKAFHLIQENSGSRADLNAIELLLKDLAGEWQSNREGESLLHAAVGSGPDLVDLLLRYGASVESCRKDGVAPLHLACEAHEHKTIELLLDHGADPTQMNAVTGGSSCLYLLLDRPIRSVVKVSKLIRKLCGAGADPDLGNTATGDTPLIVLCLRNWWRSRKMLVELMIELGADLDRRNILGYSPLMAAELTGKSHIASYLRQHGAAEDGLETAKLHAALNGSNNLIVALWTRGRSNTARALEMISFGADVNAPDPEGEVPLAAALLFAEDTLIEALIDAGAKIDFGYGDCRTPLVAAAEAGREGWVRYLLEKGADPERVTAYGKAWECTENPKIRTLLLP